METALWGIRTKFSSVKQVSTDEFASELDAVQHGALEPPLLLDVRAKAEWDVSTLKGAIHIDPQDAVESISERLLALAGSAGKARPIVAFCSIGYRSSQLAEGLTGLGWTNVRNLEGSIFKWANEGRPIEKDGSPRVHVHQYSAVWGKLLSSDLRAAL